MKRPAARSLTRGELIGALGGAALLVATFLPWYSAGGESVSAWEAFSVTDIVLAAAAAVGLSVAACVLGRISVSYPVAGSATTTLFGAVAVVLIVVRAASPPGGGSPARDVGLWLALAAAIALTCGGYLGMQPRRVTSAG